MILRKRKAQPLNQQNSNKMKYYVLLIICIFFSCEFKKDNNQQEKLIVEDSVSSKEFYEENYFENKKMMDSLYDRILKTGDTIAYNEAYNIASVSFNGDSFFYYSQIMAIEYQYPRAYYNMFINFRFKGEKLKKMSIYYLLKSYELGNENAKNDLNFIFKENKIPNSSDFFMNMESYNIEIPAY